jgi:redox-sensitive bicupin YhaK (pirin superfamily)
VAGRPLGEPVIQHGPFVMNTEQEIAEAIRDFREGRLLAGRDGAD